MENKKLFHYISIVCGLFLFAAPGCKLAEEKKRELVLWQHRTDSIGNALLDSVYKKQALDCDKNQKEKLPLLVDSILKNKKNAKH